jgi:hypothetical protein
MKEGAPLGDHPLDGTPTRLTVEYWPLSRFVPYLRNPRKTDVDHASHRHATRL